MLGFDQHDINAATYVIYFSYSILVSWLNLQNLSVEGVQPDLVDERTLFGVSRGWRKSEGCVLCKVGNKRTAAGRNAWTLSGRYRD